MLKAGVRVSDAARNKNCHPSTKQRLRDRYQATGTVKDRRRMATDVKTATYVDCTSTIFTVVCAAHTTIYIDDIRPGWLLAVPGAQWLSGRVLDSRPRGRGFESHRRHCVVVLEQDTFILAQYWFNPSLFN